MSDDLKSAIQSMKSSAALGDDLKSSVLAKVARGPDAAYMAIAPELRLTQKGKIWRALCPFPGHEDTKPSFAVMPHGGFACMGCDRSGDVFTFAHMMSGGDGKPRGRFPEVLEAVAAKLHVSTVGASLTHSALEAFNYPDIDGKIHYRKIRCADGEKRWQRREGDKWVFGRDEWKLTNGKGLLYRQDLLTGASTVVVCEGESDADEMRSLGFATTCLPDGASNGTLGRKWLPEFEEALSGLDLILIGDVDEAGENYSSDIAREMWSAAKRVKVVRLAEIDDVKKGYDCRDYLDEHGPEAMKAMIEDTPWLTERPKDAVSERFRRRVSSLDNEDAEAIDALAADINELPSGTLRERLLSELKSRVDIGLPQLRKARHVDPHGPWRFFRKSENGRITFCPPVLGRALMAEREFDYCELAGELMLYESGLWRSTDSDMVAGLVASKLDNEFKKNHAEEVLAFIRASLSDRRGGFETPPADYVNFQNGLLNMKTWELEDHTPDVQSVNQVPIDYDPSARTLTPIDSPCLEDLLDQCLDTDGDRMIVQEILGYALSPCQFAKKGFIFVGPGDTGKSTLLRVLYHLLGEANMSAIPIQKLSERFTSAGLFRKLANISADLPASEVEDSSVFKMLTGGDPIHGEIKFGKQFFFRSAATPIFSCNELPYTTDRSQAYFDRWVIIRFGNIVPKEKQVGDLDEIIWKKEPKAIAAWAVDGLKRLAERGWKFDETDSVVQMRTEYRKHADSVYAFVTDWCKSKPDASETCEDLFNTYIGYCGSERIQKPLTRRTFTRRMKEEFGLTECQKDRQRALAGIHILWETELAVRQATEAANAG